MEILQSRLPVHPWREDRTSRLPGTGPVGRDDWLMADEAQAAQLAYADHLIATRRDAVVALDPLAEPAGEELLSMVLDWTSRQPGYERIRNAVTRPDGVAVPLDGDAPLVTARRLVQEDLILHLPGPDEYRLAAGVLAFPASWTLAEKAGRGLIRVHGPVAAYDAGIAARVDRLFRGLQAERPIMRANFLLYHDADLHQPRSETARRDQSLPPRFLRVERQCLNRLPGTGAVVFSIHTFVLPLDAVDPQDLARIHALRGHREPHG